MSYNDSQNLEFQITPFSLKKNTQKNTQFRFDYLKTIEIFSHEILNYIYLFVFDDEIEMKNRSTIQTLTFVQTNPDHLYMKQCTLWKLTCDILSLICCHVYYDIMSLLLTFTW
jgi:hypothetical protein